MSNDANSFEPFSDDQASEQAVNSLSNDGLGSDQIRDEAARDGDTDSDSDSDTDSDSDSDNVAGIVPIGDRDDSIGGDSESASGFDDLNDPAAPGETHHSPVSLMALVAAFQQGQPLAPAPEAISQWFDADQYRNRYEDLAGLDDATSLQHYVAHGVWEGRSASGQFDDFDGERYLRENPDVEGYVQARLDDFDGCAMNGAIAHFVIYGMDEQRAAFDHQGIDLLIGG